MKSDEILPSMIKLTNNGHITQSVAKILSEKLSDLEFGEFVKWIKIAEDNHYKNIAKKFSVK